MLPEKANKARVLIDLEREKYPKSGLGYYCHCLERGLRELNSKAELSYYKASDTQDKQVVAYSPLHRLLNPTPRQFDLLHITHQHQHYFKRILSPKKIVVTLHDLNYLIELEANAKQKRLHRLTKSILAKADVIVCISHFVKQNLEAQRYLFQLKENVIIRVIHNGIELDETKQNHLLSYELESKINTPYLLSIGVLQYKKQQELLIGMLGHLPKTYKLVLVYSSEHREYREKLDALILEYGLGERVVFLKSVTLEEKNALLQNCEALLHPSIAEGFGIPPVEAMAYGKPVFLSRATSLPEVGGKEAFYFDEREPKAMAEYFRASMEQYNADENYPQRLREWVQKFEYRAMAKQYLLLYEECLMI